MPFTRDPIPSIYRTSSRRFPDLRSWSATTVTDGGVISFERRPNQRPVRTERTVAVLEVLEKRCRTSRRFRYASSHLSDKFVPPNKYFLANERDVIAHTEKSDCSRRNTPLCDLEAVIHRSRDATSRPTSKFTPRTPKNRNVLSLTGSRQYSCSPSYHRTSSARATDADSSSITICQYNHRNDSNPSDARTELARAPRVPP